jgi:hypothetical protein
MGASGIDRRCRRPGSIVRESQIHGPPRRTLPIAAVSTDFDAAWDDLNDGTPPLWYVGLSTFIEGRGAWRCYGEPLD